MKNLFRIAIIFVLLGALTVMAQEVKLGKVEIT